MELIRSTAANDSSVTSSTISGRLVEAKETLLVCTKSNWCYLKYKMYFSEIPEWIFLKYVLKTEGDVGLYLLYSHVRVYGCALPVGNFTNVCCLRVQKSPGSWLITQTGQSFCMPNDCNVGCTTTTHLVTHLVRLRVQVCQTRLTLSSADHSTKKRNSPSL